MANIAARDGTGSTIEFYAKGAGTPADPYRYTSEGFLPFVWKATTAGTGYAANDRLVLKQESNEAFQWYKITSTGTVSSLGNTNVPSTNREEVGGTASGGSGGTALPTLVGKAKTASGTEYAVNAEVLIFFNASGSPTGGYNLDTGTALTAAPNASHFDFLTTTSSGGSSSQSVAVSYDIVGGLANGRGLWDISANTVRAAGSTTTISVGTATGNATNLSLIENLIEQNTALPTTPTILWHTFTANRTEHVFNLVNAKNWAIANNGGVPIQYAYTVGGTTTTPFFMAIPPSVQVFPVSGQNYTGPLALSIDLLPTPVNLLNGTSVDGSDQVTFAAALPADEVVPRQVITGPGIPANTFIKNWNSTRTIVSLCDANGVAVNAAAGAGAGTFISSGAPVLLEVWN